MMEQERRNFIRKAIAKKKQSEIDEILKEELVQYIEETNAIMMSLLHQLSSYI